MKTSKILFKIAIYLLAGIALTVILPYEQADTVYRLTDADSGEVWIVSGTASLRLETPRSAKLIWVERI